MRKFVLLISLLLCSLHMMAQEKTVTGKVTDEKDGSTLSGVSVIVKGTSVGTTTGADGTFKLNVPTTAKALVFTFQGYEEVESSIGNRTTFNLAMISTSKALEEVVVVAYGKVRKEALTGSVGTIKAENIAKRPVANITKAIEGAVPGVTVTTGSGQPGSGTSIRIRGFGSINATSEPLFVVDGVPYVGGTSNINSDDVESITVLKDAASTALFGSRGANGVVMITTKKGKKGRDVLSFKIAQGFSMRGLEEYERVNASQYYPIMWQAYRNSLVYPNSGTGISLDSANRVASGLTSRNGIADLLSYNPFNVARNAIVGTNGLLNPNASLIYGDDLEWEKSFMRTGIRKDYGVTFNGGSDKTDYFMSFGYLNEEGFTKKTDFERYSARINVTTQPKTWIKTNLNISGNYSTTSFSNEDGAIANPYSWTRGLGPIYPVHLHNMTTGAYVLDDKGNKIPDLGNYANTPIGTPNGILNRVGTSYAGRNAPVELMLNEDMTYRTVVSGRSSTDITIMKGLVFTNNLSIDLQSQRESGYENTLVGDGAGLGRSRKAFNTNTGFQATQLLTYSNRFKEHNFNLLVAHESYNQMLTNLNGFRQGQSLTGNTEFSNFTTTNSLGSSVDRYRIESYFSRLIYDFDGKYNLTASLRRDGNSRFSSKSRWGTFGSVGVSWNLHKEAFINKLTWINTLKLRSSYGVVGVADDIGYYAYQGLYGFANNANEPGIVQSTTSVLNPDLTWEKNKAFDVGLEFSVLKNRISGQIEYFHRVSEDLLFSVPTPLSSGLLSATKNTATMYNKGIELQLSGDIVRKKDVIVTTMINISTVENKITKMPSTVKEFVTGTKKYSEGYSIYDYWLRQYYGVHPTDGAALFIADNKLATSGLRYIVNKNGGIDTVTTALSNAKFAYKGSAIPKYYGSLTQTVTYKGISLSALFTFQSGGLTYDAAYAGLMSSGTYGAAVHKDILKAWQKPGDISIIPRMDNARTADFNAGTSTRWLTDASFINIRTVTLSYQLPTSLTSRLKMSNAQFYITGENLSFFTARKGMNAQGAFTGVTGSGYPPARIITFGITATL
jgi:TonB-linked SusC/RagA family outer membrane protein